MDRVKKPAIPARKARALFACLLAFGLVSCSRTVIKEKSAFNLQQENTQRVKWRMATMAGEYDKVGRKDPKWDEAAHGAAESFALIQQKPGIDQREDYSTIAKLAAQAVQLGCDDPFIRYLDVVSNYEPDGKPTNEVLKVYKKVATDMQASSYSDIRKFYACLRMASVTWYYEPQPRQQFGVLRGTAMDYLKLALNDTNMPAKEARDACLAMLKALTNSRNEQADYEAMEKLLTKNFGDSSAPDAVKNAFYIDYAWMGRGYGVDGDKVTAEGWKLFAERLKVAEATATAGWKKEPGDPLLPTYELKAIVGGMADQDIVKLWFERAMQADTNNWDACSSRLISLYPALGGSAEAMLAFGRECFTNEAWGGAVRLMLVDAHWAVFKQFNVGNDYWKRPGVWDDIHESYEEYYRRNPEAYENRQNYIWYANACGDYKVVAEQLPLLRETNYDYFGGKEAFDDMVKNAREHGGK